MWEVIWDFIAGYWSVTHDIASHNNWSAWWVYIPSSILFIIIALCAIAAVGWFAVAIVWLAIKGIFGVMILLIVVMPFLIWGEKDEDWEKMTPEEKAFYTDGKASDYEDESDEVIEEELSTDAPKAIIVEEAPKAIVIEE